MTEPTREVPPHPRAPYAGAPLLKRGPNLIAVKVSPRLMAQRRYLEKIRNPK